MANYVSKHTGAQIDAAVDAFLNGGTGGTVTVDKTLTKSGAAADAKATGDLIVELTENVGKLTTKVDQFESGNKTAFDSFMDNTDVDYAYDTNTGAYYTVIRIYRDRLDGEKQYPFVLWPNDGKARTTYDLVMQEGYYLAINAGIFNGATSPDGMVIQNGVVMQNRPTTLHPNCKPLTIDGNGNLGYAADDADANDLVASGIVSAVSGFMPIVVDYAAVPQSEWNDVDHYTADAQRQIIGQWGCGDYAIITCEGRSNHNSSGWTIAEAQQICIKHGLKFAYNLDGGGSTETMLGKKHINTIYEGTTGRRVPTFIVFNGTTSLDKKPIIPEPIETYTTLEYVEFTGTQHINTGITENAAVGVEAIIEITAVEDGGRHFVSATNSYLVSTTDMGKPVCKRCGSAEVMTSVDNKVVAGETYHIKSFIGDNTCMWNDVVVSDSMAAGTAKSGTYYIGTYGGAPDPDYRHMKCKVYALNFYNNGVLTHNFVPSKSSSGAVGLLDTISNKFYESMTSTALVAGPIASEPDEPSKPEEPEEPDEPVEPDETYTTLEYVEFTGTQHINTGIAESATFGAEAEIEVTAIEDGGRHFVSATNSYLVSMTEMGKPVCKRCGSAEIMASLENKVVVGERYTVKSFIGDNTCKWNDVVISNSMAAGTTKAGTYYIGTYGGAPDPEYRHMKCKMYALKFYNDGVLTHDFVPSMNSNSEVGLLDTIGNTFYPSMTSTALVAGPIVS